MSRRLITEGFVQRARKVYGDRYYYAKVLYVAAIRKVTIICPDTVTLSSAYSGQRSQFSSDEWNRFCSEHDLVTSMSRRGNCYGNAAMESFFSSRKKEKIRGHILRARDIAKAELSDYIEVFYNRARVHQHLGNISPKAFEQNKALSV